MIVGVLIVGAAAVFAITTVSKRNLIPGSQLPPNESKESGVKTTTKEEGLISGSILDLMKLGKSVKCTYSIDITGNKMDGVSYVSGEKVRGDFNTTGPEDSKTESHMISDGGWVYVWNSVMPQGFKMKISDVEESVKPESSQDQAPTGNASLDTLQKKFDYKCDNWAPDNSVFDVPTDVTFTDFSDTMKSLGNKCSACELIKDTEGKETCKKQLGC